MKPKMSAAQLEARRKAGSPQPSDTYMQRRYSNAKTDCEEKRDPDERQRPKRNKENELDLNTQLEKQPFAAPSTNVGSSDKAPFRKIMHK